MTFFYGSEPRTPTIDNEMSFSMEGIDIIRNLIADHDPANVKNVK